MAYTLDQRLCAGVSRFHDVIQGEMVAGSLQVSSAAVDPGDLQQIIDETDELPGLTLHGTRHPLDDVPLCRRGFEHLDSRADGSERITPRGPAPPETRPCGGWAGIL